MSSTVAEAKGMQFKNEVLHNENGAWTNKDMSVTIELNPFAPRSKAKVVEECVKRDNMTTNTIRMNFHQESGKLTNFSVTHSFKEMEDKREKGKVHTITFGVGVENEERWMREFKTEAGKGGSTATYMDHKMKKVPGGWHYKDPGNWEIRISGDFTRVDESHNGSHGWIDYTKMFGESDELRSYKSVSRGMARGKGFSHRGGTLVDLDVMYEEAELKKLRSHPNVDLGDIAYSLLSH